MYQLILHKLQAACCIERAAGGMRVARGSKVELVCVCLCVWVRVCVNDGGCLFPVSNNYLFGSGAKMFFLWLPFAQVKVLGVMAIILIIIILKTSLQVIRGSSWRREPLKSISESYCFQWKIKPTQDCCEDAARLVCEMWRYLAVTSDTSPRLSSSLSGSTEEQCTLPVALHARDEMAERHDDQLLQQHRIPKQYTFAALLCLLVIMKSWFYIPDSFFFLVLYLCIINISTTLQKNQHH